MDQPAPEGDQELEEWFRSLPPEEQARLLSQHSVVMPARNFVKGVWSDRDLLSVWHLTDPLFRTCLAQKWLCDNSASVQRDGLDRDDVVTAFVEDAPDHPLWHHFERAHLRGFAHWDDLSEWSTGTEMRLHGPDVEAVVFFPPGVKVWNPGEVQQIYTFLMKHSDDAGWRVLNVCGEMIPEPGWPPRLSQDD